MTMAAPSAVYDDSAGLELIFDIVIVVCGIVGIFFALVCAYLVSRIKVRPEAANEGSSLNHDNPTPYDVQLKVADISDDISKGAIAFLFSEYKIMAIFMVGMSVVIVVLLGSSGNPLWAECPAGKESACRWIDGVFSAIAFNIGALTSIISGFLGMRIAVFSNSRTALMANEGYAPAFGVAFKGGIVMGFGLTSLGLLNLFLTIMFFRLYYQTDSHDVLKIQDARKALLSAVAPFGLGGSSIALFGRVGGGIFTKAADVGADLVGKVEKNIPEDDPRNPGVVADNVGDNVGDIAGMGSDLFGSFGEATCAALVVSTTSPELLSDYGYLLFPLMVTAVGLIACMLTAFVAFAFPPQEANKIEPCLKIQLIVSTVLLTCIYAPVTYACLPHPKGGFELGIIFREGKLPKSWWEVYLCILAGLWSGLIIGLCTEYYTSHAHSPTQRVAKACVTGAATNIIHGLALGYASAIVPCFCIGFSIYFSLSLCGCYGVAMAALGILSSMSIGLTIDAYGPISDNAGGIAEMAGMHPEVRMRTDALDGAGNTTAAIGKGFAIGSAAFVGVALFGAFMTQVYSQSAADLAVNVNILDPRTFFGLCVGAMLPYWFSAMTMKSVGKAAMEMVVEIQRQFAEIEGLAAGAPGVKPDSQRCIEIATNASLKEMIAPGALVVLTPILTGIFFGPECLAGLLPGSMASGVMMATSAANTGGAWDNAKKYIEADFMKPFGKGSDPHKAAVVGDTVGDPLKDTSGPALNILVKLMAIISVVFAPMMAYDKQGEPGKAAGLIFNRLICHYWHHHACPAPPK